MSRFSKKKQKKKQPISIPVLHCLNLNVSKNLEKKLLLIKDRRRNLFLLFMQASSCINFFSILYSSNLLLVVVVVGIIILTCVNFLDQELTLLLLFD